MISPTPEPLDAPPAAGRPAAGLEQWLPLVIVVTGLLAYHNSFFGPFVFDDEPNIVAYPPIRHWWPFEGEHTLPGRALVRLSLAVNYGLGGLQVWGYHAFNLAAHLLAALALYGVVRRTLSLEPQRVRYQGRAPWLALAAALLWVVHPLQTESVTYVIQRSESLMGLCYLLTVYCVVRGAETSPGRWWYAAAVASCALGMLSKEVMCTAPVLVLFYDRTFLAPSFGQVLRRRWALYLGLAATWGLLSGTVLTVLGTSAPPGANPTVGFGVKGVTPAAYALSQPGIIVHYLRLTFWPEALCLDYGWPPADTAGAVLGPGLALAALLVATLWALYRRPRLGYCGAWFFLILAPTSSVVPVADLAFEHRMYLSLAAVAVLAGLGGDALVRLAVRRLGLGAVAYAGLTVGLVAAPVVLLGWRTVRRNEDYRDPVALWAGVVAQRPDNARGYTNLGEWLSRAGKYEEAERSYRAALRLRPAYDVHYNLGLCLRKQGKVEEAMEEYRTALRLEPDYAEAHSNLGTCLLSQDKVDEAVEEFATAVRLKPDYAEAHCNLGLGLSRQGKVREAEQEFRAAVRLKPGYAEAHCNLGSVAAGQGRMIEAEHHFREALRADPGLGEGHYNLGLCLLAEGEREEALAHFRAAERINPRFRRPDTAGPPGARR